MTAWLHKIRCWLDEHAHMTLWVISGATEGFDLTPFATPLTDFIGQKGVSGIVLVLAGLGMWRSRVTRQRGKEMKAEIHDLKTQVEQTGQVPVIPEKPIGSV
jgi:hypothetical protein